eukprot:TRINITY_DN3124_c0_g1_i1.p1 TRINITY_DN3124_c0_g1~~TRINITY_DN3124_c0_g1_i1.p1  ORF type:complete len:247 (+),score=55.28 TRINITY_DN3124_c0_g1_i1:116-856(+)
MSLSKADPTVLAMESLTKFLATTAGKDKVAKILQYGGLFVSYHASKKNPKSELAAKAKKIQAAAGAARKVFRLGNSIGDYLKIRQVILAGNVFAPLNLLAFFRSFGLYWYWIFDHLVWLGNTGVAKVDSSKFSFYSSAAWFLGLISSIILDIVALLDSIKKEKELRLKYYRLSPGQDTKELDTQTKANKAKKSELSLNCVKNAADLCIASTLLNIRKFSPGTVGFCGMLSAFIASYQLMPPIQPPK